MSEIKQPDKVSIQQWQQLLTSRRGYIQLITTRGSKMQPNDFQYLYTLLDHSSEVWIYTLQTSLEVHRNMFKHKPRASLGLIFFTVLIQKSEKQWKVLSVMGKVCPREIPRANFSRQHCRLSTVYTECLGKIVTWLAGTKGQAWPFQKYKYI